MAETVNQTLLDRLTARQLRLARVEAAQRREVWDRLQLLEADLLSALKSTDPFERATLARRKAALEAFLHDEVEPLVTTRYGGIAALMNVAMLALARQEVQATQRMMQAVVGEPVVQDVPSDAHLRRVVIDTLIPTATRPTDLSAPGAVWWERQGVGLTQRLGDQLRVSVSLQESLTQAVARVRGTADLAFHDGVMARARDDAARLVRLQVTNAASEARVALADVQRGRRLIAIHSSILDSRTSMICLGRHGLRYTIPAHEPIGHSVPYLSGVPYHIGCRSSIVVGLATGGAVLDESLSSWLRRQSTAMQDEVLGPTRARMFREGKFSQSDLLEAATGRPLRLEELDA